ncbi:hypothetical protein DCC62_05550 [candidate division KSB1 bacterium]|nr:MAG: hypothetical protein DCC62_05550 [candidate division KSB1 bacterium]
MRAWPFPQGALRATLLCLILKKIHCHKASDTLYSPKEQNAIKGNIMELRITPEIQKAVHEAMRVGGYNSAEEYINEALENYYRLKLERLNFEIAIGLEQAKRGELIEASEIRFDDLLSEAKKMR